MEVTPFTVDVLKPPQDDLLAKIQKSELSLEEGDVIALSSKVVSIWQGRCVLKEGADKDALVKQEAELYLERSESPGSLVMHTITNGTLIPSAGIDPFGGYYILWPEKPQETAQQLLEWFKKEYKRERLFLVLTDSRSVFLRQEVIWMTVAWAGFEPVFDNLKRKDLLGFSSACSQPNVADSLAAVAVFTMGEANEQTPLVRIRNAPYVNDKNPSLGQKEKFESTIEEDIFAPFLKSVPWKKGKSP